MLDAHEQLHPLIPSQSLVFASTLNGYDIHVHVMAGPVSEVSCFLETILDKRTGTPNDRGSISRTLVQQQDKQVRAQESKPATMDTATWTVCMADPASLALNPE